MTSEPLAIVEARLRARASAGDFEGAAVALNEYRVALEQVLRSLGPGAPEGIELQRRTEELLCWLDRVARSSRAHLEGCLRSLPHPSPYRPPRSPARHTWRLDA